MRCFNFDVMNSYVAGCCLLLLAACFMFSGLVISVSAQSGGGVDLTGTSGSHTIQGRIYVSSGQRINARLKVRLESTGFGELSVLSDGNGSFSFRSLGPGAYTVVVEGGSAFETVRERVFIEQEAPDGLSGRRVSVSRIFTVPIYLQPKRVSGSSVKPAVINAALVNVPKPAQDLFYKALEAARSGNDIQAIANLKQAVALYPQFGLAFSELGMLYLKLRRFNEAADSLRVATTLMPEVFLSRLHYGISLFEKQQFKDAQTQLREAIKRKNSSPIAHLYLGMTLMRMRDLEEAETELRRSIELSGEGDLGTAHYYLGGIYWGKRQYKRAADELETYLRLTPAAPDAERVKSTIKELRSKG